jgi:hypothetical protein
VHQFSGDLLVGQDEMRPDLVDGTIDIISLHPLSSGFRTSEAGVPLGYRSQLDFSVTTIHIHG